MGLYASSPALASHGKTSCGFSVYENLTIQSLFLQHVLPHHVLSATSAMEVSLTK